MRSRYRRLLLVLGSSAVMSACSPSANVTAPAAGNPTLHRGLGGEPGSLDPALAGDSFSSAILRDVYEGLTTAGPDGSIVPGIAESWTVSEDGTRYVFKLRRDAKWSNGEPVRAEDFLRAWKRELDRGTGSPVVDDLRIIAGAKEIIAGRAFPDALKVTVAGPDELVVILEAPAAYFLELLTHSALFPIYSDEAAKSHGGASWVSDGPYVLKSWTPGGSIELGKNPNYYARDSVAIPNVEYVPVPNDQSELQRYRAGQLDITESVPTAAAATLRKEQPQELKVAPYLATAFYVFNLRRAPFKNNHELRQALTMVIDRRILLTSILPFGQNPAFGLVPPGTSNYTPQTWGWADWPDAQRVAEAKRLYAKAGYSTRTPLRLRLLYNSNPAIKQLAVAVSSMWKEELGVETDMHEEEYRSYLADRKDTTQWDLVRFAWSGDYSDATSFLDIFRKGSPNNDAAYDNAQFDTLLNDAERTVDIAARRAQLESAERMMLEDYPVLPLYFLSSKHLVKPYVHGYYSSPLNRVYTRYLSLGPH